MTKSNSVPKQLDAIVDTVLSYRPKARSKPSVQRKRRRTILDKQRGLELAGAVVSCRTKAPKGEVR